MSRYAGGAEVRSLVLEGKALGEDGGVSRERMSNFKVSNKRVGY